MSKDEALRPKTFAEYLGQSHIMPSVEVMVKSARKRDDSVGHLLFSGPPGLGKTTVAQVVANEIGSNLHFVNAPTLTNGGQLKLLLFQLKEHDVLFIDEIHRLTTKVEEALYPAVEDFTVEITAGDDATRRVRQIQLPKFTLIGATTRQGYVSRPMRTRFQHIAQMRFYTDKELTQIAIASSEKLGLKLTQCGAESIAAKARGTPRTANKHLLTLQDHAVVDGKKLLDRPYVDKVLSMMGIDSIGLGHTDRDYLDALINKFNCKPTGLKTICVNMGEEEGTIEEIEGYMLQRGLIRRTTQGRVPTEAAIEHMRGRR